MKEQIKDGGPAFPVTLREFFTGEIETPGGMMKVNNMPQTKEYPGMSLRDYFAAKAMAAFYSNPNLQEGVIIDGENYGPTAGAYAVADAMLAAREARP
jgi:hypothetical protein